MNPAGWAKLRKDRNRCPGKGVLSSTSRASKIALCLTGAHAAGSDPNKQTDAVCHEARAPVAERNIDAVGMTTSSAHINLGCGCGGRRKAVAGEVAGPLGVFRDWIAIAKVALGGVGRKSRAELVTKSAVIPN